MKTKWIANKATLNILYRRNFLIENKYGCLQELMKIRSLHEIFELKLLTKESRARVFLELFGDEERCQFSEETHGTGLTFILALAASMIVRMGDEIELSDAELKMIAHFLSVNSRRVEEFASITNNVVEANQLEIANKNAYLGLIRQPEVTRDMLLLLIPIFGDEYRKVYQNIDEIKSNSPFGPKSTATYSWNMRYRLERAEGILKALVLNSAKLTPEDLLQLAYDGNQIVREMATRNKLCPPEGRVASALLG